jgi:selenide,water dikinase
VPGVSDPNLLVGLESFDDAAVYRLNDDTALVLTVDFFPPPVDDPYAFGQIAAANSLSDIYAMGARPLAALNIVGYPEQELPLEWLGEILRGGAERVAAAGAVVAGGHSVRDAEVKFGLSVTGVVHPQRVLTNAGARPGDVLVLTKPLGSGVLTKAAKQGRAGEAELAEAIASMSELNRGACEAVVELNGERPPGGEGAPVSAMTDITGFGLIGHGFELAQASGVSLQLWASQVPMLPGTLELARRNMVSRAYRTNLAHVGKQLAIEGVEEVQVRVLADAQTSGGLLIAVDSQQASALLERLEQRGVGTRALVGRVVHASDAAVQVVPS